MNAFVLVTDGQQVLLFRKDSNWSLPDTQEHWPLEWQRKSLKSTIRRLLLFCTYGIIDIDALWKPKTQTIHHVFGLPKEYKCYVIQIDKEIFQYLLVSMKHTLQHIQNIYKQDPKLFFTVMSSEDIQNSKQCSLQTIHCVRAFLDINK
jgi:hypothetical protein